MLMLMWCCTAFTFSVLPFWLDNRKNIHPTKDCSSCHKRFLVGS